MPPAARGSKGAAPPAAAGAKSGKARHAGNDVSAANDALAEVEAAEHSSRTAKPASAAPAAKAAAPQKPAPHAVAPAAPPTDRQKDVQDKNKLLELQTKAADAEKEKAVLAEKVARLQALLQQTQKAGRGKPKSEKPKPTNGQRRLQKVNILVSRFFIHP